MTDWDDWEADRFFDREEARRQEWEDNMEADLEFDDYRDQLDWRRR